MLTKHMSACLAEFPFRNSIKLAFFVSVAIFHDPTSDNAPIRLKHQKWSKFNATLKMRIKRRKDTLVRASKMLQEWRQGPLRQDNVRT